MHSEQPNSTPVSHTNDQKPSFDVKKHFSDSWKLMTDKLLGMILQMLLFFSFEVMLGIVVVIAGFALVIGNAEFMSMMNSETIPTADVALSMFGSLFGQIAGILGVAFVLYMFFAYVYSGAVLFLVGQERKVGFGEALGVGFKKGFPVFILGTITGLMTLGGFMLFVIPGIAIMLMLLFAIYIYILENTSILGAMKRSVQMVSTHFALVLGRFILILIPSILLSVLTQMMYRVPEMIFLGMTFSFIGTLALSFFAVPYYITLYKHLDRKTPKDTNVSMLWMYIVSALGLILLSVLLYFGISKGVPFIKEQIAAEIAREEASEEPEVEFSDYIDSSCGITIPITNTYDEQGRRWIYEERWVSSDSIRGFAPEDQVRKNGLLAVMVQFKSNADRNPEKLEEGERFKTAFPGFVMFCTANTEELSLEEFVAQAQETEEGTVELSKIYEFGELTVQSLQLSGVYSDGNYYSEPLYLATTPENLIIIQLWQGDVESVEQESEAIIYNLMISEDAEPVKNSESQAQTKTQNTAPAQPSCQQLKIYEGEFASDKCYSAQDYKDLQYYLQAYNSAIFTYNGAISRINVVCNGSEFFKNNCEEAQREKSDAEGKISQYKGTIQSIMSRGK